MARTGRPALQKGSKRPAASKKAAAKSKKPNKAEVLDVYAYDNTRKGKANQRIKGDAQEGKGKGRAVEDDDEPDERPQYTLGGDDVEFHSSQDEEIDSDMADTSGEEDQEWPANRPKPKQKPQKAPTKSKGREIDLNEDSEPENSEDGQDYVDLSTMLDRPTESIPEDSGSEGSESGSVSDEEDALSLSEEEDAGEAAEKLQSLIDALPQNKRPLEGDGATSSKKRRKIMPEQTEAWEENQFASMGLQGESQKVKIEDLRSALPAAQQASMRKSLQPLLSSKSNKNASVLKSAGPLPAPLELRQQARVDRAAAKEKLDTELATWQDTMSTVRGIGSRNNEFGDHRISLPLAQPGSAGPTISSTNKNVHQTTAEWGSKFKSSSVMERDVIGLLNKEGMNDARTLGKVEAREMGRMSAEDQQARTNALREQRELMFRAEKKAKRVAKIKSKTYRRLARKEAARRGEKNQLSLDEMEQLDEVDGGSRAAEMREKMEVDRARERAGLRHSTKNGRFSQVASQGISGLEEDEHRVAERERMQKEERLKRRVLGKGDKSDEDSDEASQDSNAEDDEEAIRDRAFDELASFDLQEAKKAEAAQAGKKSGLMGMKFMQAGMAREQAKADDLEAQFRRELDGEDEEDTLDQSGVVGNRVDSNIGRMVFAPSAAARASNEIASQQTPAETPRTNEHRTKVSKALPLSQAAPAAAPPSQDGSSVNPWLQAETSGKQSRTKNDTSTTSTGAEKVASKAKKQQKKSTAAKEKEQDEQQVVIDLDNVLGKPTPAPKKPKMNKKAKAAAAAAAALEKSGQKSEQDSDEDDDQLPADEPALIPQRQTTAFQQRDLVKRAFANDNVVSDFQEAKRKEIEADAPQDVDETIPGWGSWGGKGVKKNRKAKKYIKHVPGIATEDRMDAGLSHVIINEKRDKKATKYLAKDLPYPYTNATQHEYALRQPLGPEFQTTAALRAHTRPKVLIKPGSIIDPIAKRL